MKRKYMVILIILILIFSLTVGCEATDYSKATKTIYWVVERTKIEFNKDNELVEDNYDNTIRALNRELKQDGYNLKIQIVQLGDPTKMNYSEALKNYLNSGKPADIITLFNAYDNFIKGDDVKFIDDRNFISFDNFNKSDVEVLLKKGTKLEWDRVRHNGEIYSIPAGDFNARQYAYLFNKVDNIPNAIDSTSIVNAAKSGGFIFPYLSDLTEVAARTKLAYINSIIFSDGEIGTIDSLYNQKNFIDMLKLYNSLFKKGYINNITDIDESLLEEKDKEVFASIPKDTELSLLNTNQNIDSLLYLLDKYNRFSVALKINAYNNENSLNIPLFISSKILGSTGIYSKSKNANDAFKVLFLSNTKKEYSDILLHGLEGTDFTKKNGMINNPSNDFLDRVSAFKLFYNRTAIDLSNKSEEESSNINTFFPIEEEQLKLNSKAIPSPYIGFNFNSKGYENIITKCNEIATKNLDIWKSDNLEAELERVRKELSDAGVDKLTEEVRRQVEEWKKIVE